MKRLIIILCLLIPAMAGAEDKTPYKFIFGGNSYSGTRNASVTWLAERFDVGMAGLADWDYMLDSIWDTCQSWTPAKTFRCGPYQSTQELNLYFAGHPEYTYDYRLSDTDGHWLVVYAEAYMDSIGVSRETLYVHYLDTFVSITQDGDGLRNIDRMDTLSHRKRRFSYQYWNNTSSDTGIYPNGYCWLANGMSNYTKTAIAYAFKRHFVEDSARSGYQYPGDHHWDCWFADNQYRNGAGGDSAAPRLYSYYDGSAFTVAGGTSAHLDWTEIDSLHTTNLRYYYDYSTLAIDSAIDYVLDSVSTAKSWDKIRRYANVDKYNVTMFAIQIKKTSCLLENPLDYTKSWSNYQQWYAISDTMAGRTTAGSDYRELAWMFLGDFLVNEATWRTSDRMYYAHYAFFLNLYETNILCGPNRFNDSLRWRDVYHVDFGSPVAKRDSTNKTGTGTTAIHVLQRKFLQDSPSVDTSITLMRSAHGTADYEDDSIWVKLWDGGADTSWYYQVDVNADTSATPVCSIALHPYQGWIGIQNLGLNAAPSIGTITPTTGTQNVEGTVEFTVTDINTGEIASVDCYLWAPNSDSISLIDKTYSPAHASPVDTSKAYTWLQTGNYSMVVVAVDDSSAVSRDSVTCVVSAAPAAADSNKIHFGNGIHFKNGIEVK